MSTTTIQPSLIFEENNHTRSINELEQRLFSIYADIIGVDININRRVVSYQANKNFPKYRWYKFKEAFSASLVEYFLSKYSVPRGNILDPFAGSGTTLFSANHLGYCADGIELLPIGQEIINSRLIIENLLTKEDIDRLIGWVNKKPWEKYEKTVSLSELRITRQAYPPATHRQIENYLSLLTLENSNVYSVLHFALLCVLEDVSYTRKDGQYLRWDSRAKKSQYAKGNFQKSKIEDFSDAITKKIFEIINDYESTDQAANNGLIRLFSGSNLEILPSLFENSYEAIITSPPYCNRYDYTRTYALELAILGLDDEQVIKLRQQMLSSTVENRAKELLSFNPSWEKPLFIVRNQELLQKILETLEELKNNNELNNAGIPRMIRGYFEEMSCIIFECYRLLKPNSRLFMVNDNVRYAGISIPVDLIFSNIAEQIGFKIEKILVLQNGKGNSSQQMGKHGREELRKCVYIWRKT